MMGVRDETQAGIATSICLIAGAFIVLMLAAFGEPQSAWLICDVFGLEDVCR